MSVYIPMSRMTRVAIDDFHKVAPYGDPEVFGVECPNRKGKMGVEVQISGVGNSNAKPVTCRDKVGSKLILCDGCNAQFQHAKEAMEEGFFGDEFIYLGEDDTQGMVTKSFKDTAIGWATANPFLAVAGAFFTVTTVIGAIAGLGCYLSRSSDGIVESSKADAINPETNGGANNSTSMEVPTPTTEVFVIRTPTTKVPATEAPEFVATTAKSESKPSPVQSAKPTDKGATATATTSKAIESQSTTAQVTEAPKTTLTKTTLSEKPTELNLNLDIYNAQNAQPIGVRTTQRFVNGTTNRRMHTVPPFGQAKLTFDINAKHHDNVEVRYINYFEPRLRDDQNIAREIPTKYDFDSSLLERNDQGFIQDKNGDGTINVAHTFYADDKYYVLNRVTEAADGKVSPPVTKPITLFIKNALSVPANIRVIEERGGKLSSVRAEFPANASTSHTIKIGTSTILGDSFVLSRKAKVSGNRFSTSQFPVDAEDNMCLLFTESNPTNFQLLQPGKCDSGTIPTTTPARPPKLADSLELALEIDNNQARQDLLVKTEQTFTSGQSPIIQHHIVHTHSKTQLIFDINKHNHNNVKISYMNKFIGRIWDIGNTLEPTGTDHNFWSAFFSKQNTINGAPYNDKNSDGIYQVNHIITTKDTGGYSMHVKYERLTW